MTSPIAYTFGRFRLLPGARLLIADEAPQKLGGRAFDILLALVERSERTVSKNELMDLVWPRLVVEENNLEVHMVALRKLLGHQAVATVPGRGYRLTMPVTIEGGTAPVADTSRDVDSATRAVRTSPLLGRTHDLAALLACIRDHRLVTVAGAGGIGKTRIAQAAADAARAGFADGAAWIELAALVDGAMVPAAVARGLGIQLGADPDGTHAVVQVLRTQRLLLVLDNCEHVLDAVAALVVAIRNGAPGIHVLVTSQEVLKSLDECVFRLGSLTLPDADTLEASVDSSAVALFVARAVAADRRFALTAQNAAAVVAICRHLDGIPLAIEFAAARLPLLGVEGIRAHLGERFNILTAGSRVALRRHQTLRAALEWSHGLLTPDEAAVFRRLGVFSGGFTLELAQSICDDDTIDQWDVLEHLGALVDKSLVLAEGDPVPRYRVLETTRLFALERLADADETRRSMRRHAEAMIERLEVAYAARWFASADAGIGAELENVRIAMDWSLGPDGDAAMAVNLAATAMPLWIATVLTAEGDARCRAVAHRIDATLDPERVARFWLTTSSLAMYSTRRAPIDAALRAAASFRALGNPRGEYEAHVVRAAVHARRREHVAASDAVRDAAALLDRSWPAARRASLAFVSWLAALYAERYDEAVDHASSQVEINREAGRRAGEAIALGNLGGAEICIAGREDAGEAHIHEAIAMLQALGLGSSAGHMTYALATSLLQRGRLDEARTRAVAAARLLRRENDQGLLLNGFLSLLAARRGDLELAARVAGHVRARDAREGLEPYRLQRLALDHLRTRLPIERLDRLLDEGALLGEDDALAAVLGPDA